VATVDQYKIFHAWAPAGAGMLLAQMIDPGAPGARPAGGV
jgi:hypothetical protein